MDSGFQRLAMVATVAALVALAGGIIGGALVTVASEPGVCNAVDGAERGLPSVVTISAGNARGGGSGSGAVLRPGGSS